MTKPVMPYFCFARRRDIELEGGFTLAGQLVLDELCPKNDKQEARLQQVSERILKLLMAEVGAGRMPDGAMIFGWRNAVDTNNHALMAAWAKDRITIAVRIDPRPSGTPIIDSDIMQQMGLIPNAEGKAQ